VYVFSVLFVSSRLPAFAVVYYCLLPCCHCLFIVWLSLFALVVCLFCQCHLSICHLFVILVVLLPLLCLLLWLAVVVVVVAQAVVAVAAVVVVAVVLYCSCSC
jgi:hypothetical protein